MPALCYSPTITNCATTCYRINLIHHKMQCSLATTPLNCGNTQCRPHSHEYTLVASIVWHMCATIALVWNWVVGGGRVEFPQERKSVSWDDANFNATASVTFTTFEIGACHNVTPGKENKQTKWTDWIVGQDSPIKLIELTQIATNSGGQTKERPWVRDHLLSKCFDHKW